MDIDGRIERLLSDVKAYAAERMSTARTEADQAMLARMIDERERAAAIIQALLRRAEGRLSRGD